MIPSSTDSDNEVVGLWDDAPQSPRIMAQTSYLLAGFQALIIVLWFLSAVEYLKVAFMRRFDEGKDRLVARSHAIDAYMAFKWALVLFFTVFKIDSFVTRFVIFYLIFSTIFSYFYYHIWRENIYEFDQYSQHRRTAAFIFSFFFGIFCYAYLFRFSFSEEIVWPNSTGPTFTDALLLSFSNAFTAGFANFVPLTASVRWVMASETLFVFIFLVVVIINSMPARN